MVFGVASERVSMYWGWECLSGWVGMAGGGQSGQSGVQVWWRVGGLLDWRRKVGLSSGHSGRWSGWMAGWVVGSRGSVEGGVSSGCEWGS